MPSVNSSNVSNEIKAEYTLQDNTFVSKATEIVYEVGDLATPDNFLPQIKSKFWDNETNASMRLIDDDPDLPIITTEANKIIWEKNKIMAKFYSISASPGLFEKGGFEFEVILKEKPKKNEITFSINTKGLAYIYQPPLNEGDLPELAISATATEAFDKDGHRVAYRPENIIGSFAVYSIEKKINYKGGKNYANGKVGHIPRPIIHDSAGNKVFGDMIIKEGPERLVVTIPQEFLDSAVYPVYHAAGLTFGYTTTPGSYAEHAGGTVRIQVDYAPDTDGSVDSIFLYMGATSTSAHWRPVLYKSDYTRVTYGADTLPGGNQWISGAVTAANVTSGTNYGPGVWLANTQDLGYDVGLKTLKRMTQTYSSTGSPNDPFSYASQIVLSYYGIYAQYTASSGAPPATAIKDVICYGMIPSPR